MGDPTQIFHWLKTAGALNGYMLTGTVRARVYKNAQENAIKYLCHISFSSVARKISASWSESDCRPYGKAVVSEWISILSQNTIEWFHNVNAILF